MSRAIRSKLLQNTEVRVTGRKSLSTKAIGFLLAGIISPNFQIEGISWVSKESWKMIWMIGSRLWRHFLRRRGLMLSGPDALRVLS